MLATLNQENHLLSSLTMSFFIIYIYFQNHWYAHIGSTSTGHVAAIYSPVITSMNSESSKFNQLEL